MNEVLAAKLETLAGLLKQSGPSLVAVSGGLDSRFLARMAREHCPAAGAVFFSGPHVTPGERDWARQWLAQWGGPWQELAVDPLALPEVAASDPMRCYHCKRALFSQALELAGQLGCATVMDGSNRSDHDAYRPGMRALEELGVASPLDQAGLAKDEIRAAARELGLERWDQPARPCLLTRFPYGKQVDAAVLPRLGRTEDALAALGLRDFRLRLEHERGSLLQLGPGEVEPWSRAVNEALALLAREGFTPVCVEWSDRVSGHYDRARQ